MLVRGLGEQQVGGGVDQRQHRLGRGRDRADRRRHAPPLIRSEPVEARPVGVGVAVGGERELSTQRLDLGRVADDALDLVPEQLGEAVPGAQPVEERAAPRDPRR